MTKQRTSRKIHITIVAEFELLPNHKSQWQRLSYYRVTSRNEEAMSKREKMESALFSLCRKGRCYFVICFDLYKHNERLFVTLRHRCTRKRNLTTLKTKKSPVSSDATPRCTNGPFTIQRSTLVVCAETCQQAEQLQA